MKISLTRKELENFAVHTLGMAKAGLKRMSTQFLAQLLQLKINGDVRALDMVREISYLENLRRGVGALNAGIRNTLEEWIVFRRYNGVNYYLTMARLNDGDQNIDQLVRQAYEFDFPFLREGYEQGDSIFPMRRDT